MMKMRFWTMVAAAAGLISCGSLLAFRASAQQAPSQPLSQAQVTQLRRTATALLDGKVIDWAIATILAADPPDTRPHIVVFDHQARWKKISATLGVARALAEAGMLAKSINLYRRSGIEAELDNADGDTARRWARTQIAYYTRNFNKGLLGGGPGVVPQAQEFTAGLERLVAGDPKAKGVIEKGIAEIKKYPFLARYSPDSCGSSEWEDIVEDINYIGPRAPIPDDYKGFEGRSRRVVNYEVGSAAVSAASKGRMSEKDAMLVGTIGRCVAYHSLIVRRSVPLALEQIANTIDVITENSRVAARAALAAHGTNVGSEQRTRSEILQLNNERQVEDMVGFLAWLSLGMPEKSDTESKQSAARPAAVTVKNDAASSAKPVPQPAPSASARAKASAPPSRIEKITVPAECRFAFADLAVEHAHDGAFVMRVVTVDGYRLSMGLETSVRPGPRYGESLAAKLRLACMGYLKVSTLAGRAPRPIIAAAGEIFDYVTDLDELTPEELDRLRQELDTPSGGGGPRG